MRYVATSPEDYLAQLPEEQQSVLEQLRKTVLQNIPPGFTECINYNMIGYVVQHSAYPAGYHCDPKQPLPFINLAAQKNFVALYHMGLYADETLLAWFTQEYPKHSTSKLDIGKSCLRFKKTADIPFDLIGELMHKMTVEQWIALYEKKFKK